MTNQPNPYPQDPSHPDFIGFGEPEFLEKLARFRRRNKIAMLYSLLELYQPRNSTS